MKPLVPGNAALDADGARVERGSDKRCEDTVLLRALVDSQV